MTNPKPTDEDRKNYSYNIRTSPFYKEPGSFLRLGQKVQAKFRIFDLPNGDSDDWGWVSAEAGELGEVVHVQDGYWPTVRFEKTGCATCVTDLEVVAVEPLQTDEEAKRDIDSALERLARRQAGTGLKLTFNNG